MSLLSRPARRKGSSGGGATGPSLSTIVGATTSTTTNSAAGAKAGEGSSSDKPSAQGLQQQQQQQQAQQQAQAQDYAFPLSKLWTPNEDWERDEFLDVVYWLRQLLGLCCGLLWGALPLTGALPLLSFLVLNWLLVYGYYSQVLRVDDEEYGGHFSVSQEGFMPSFALFLLCWIFVYTCVFHQT